MDKERFGKTRKHHAAGSKGPDQNSSFQSKVCPGLIGWVVVEQFAGMMYLLKAYYHIIVIDVCVLDTPGLTILINES